MLLFKLYYSSVYLYNYSSKEDNPIKHYLIYLLLNIFIITQSIRNFYIENFVVTIKVIQQIFLIKKCLKNHTHTHNYMYIYLASDNGII